MCSRKKKNKTKHEISRIKIPPCTVYITRAQQNKTNVRLPLKTISPDKNYLSFNEYKRFNMTLAFHQITHTLKKEEMKKKLRKEEEKVVRKRLTDSFLREAGWLLWLHFIKETSLNRNDAG